MGSAGSASAPDDGLVVPLVFRGRTYGALVAIDRLDGGRFTTEHQRLLEAFAASAATAVATAQSVADERRRQTLAAAEAERGRGRASCTTRRSRASARLRLMLAARGAADDFGAITEAVGEAVEQLEADIANLRGLIADLRPAEIDELGAEAAINALAERFAAKGLAVDVSVELADRSAAVPVDRHSPELETRVYRIVQEALTNATKHGRPTARWSRSSSTTQAVHVTVRDDGHGFDPAVETSGFGLLGMRERAELLGGTLAVHSAPGRGANDQGEHPRAAGRRNERLAG